MNKVLFNTCLTCVLALLSSCQRMYSVKGTADSERIEGRMVALKLPSADGQWTMVDSCEVTHGSFSMKGKVDSAVIATLFVDDVPLMPLILEKGAMNVDISNLDLRVSGTPLNNKLYAFIDDKNKLDSRVMELNHTESQMIMNGTSDAVVQHYVDSTFSALNEEMMDLVTDFISSNYTNVLGVCGFSMLSNGLDYPRMTPLIKRVLDDAPQSFKDLPVVSHFVKAAGENEKEMSGY